MKSWFAKLRISFLLDDGRSLPPELSKQIAQSEELRRFAGASASLERALKNSAPRLKPPASLHGSIIRAVQAAGRPVSPRPAPLAFGVPPLGGAGTQPPKGGTPNRVFGRLLRPGWLAAPALGVAVVLGACWFARWRSVPAAEPVSWSAAVSALDMSEQVTQNIPATLVAPLSEEWQRLNRDVDDTAEFLLASLP